MSDTLCEILLSEIDITDESYRLDVSTDDASGRSMQIPDTGLAYPPIVRPVQQKYIVIAGFNRISDALKQNTEKIWVLKTSSDISDLDCLIRSILATRFKQPLSPYQIMRSVIRLSSILTKDQICSQSCDILGQKTNLSYIEKILLFQTLPKLAHKLISSGKLSFKAAEILVGLKDADVILVLNIFNQLKISKNKQIEILKFFKESAKRDNNTIAKIYTQLDIDGVLGDDTLDSSMKLNTIRERLFALRYPALCEYMTKRAHHINGLKLNGIQFTPSQSLEQERFTITFNVKNLEEYQSKINQLNASLSHESINKIFKK